MNFKFYIQILINFLGSLVISFFNIVNVLLFQMSHGIIFLGKPYSFFLQKLKFLGHKNIIYLLICIIFNILKIIVILGYLFCMYKFFNNYELFFDKYFTYYENFSENLKPKEFFVIQTIHNVLFIDFYLIKSLALHYYFFIIVILIFIYIFIKHIIIFPLFFSMIKIIVFTLFIFNKIKNNNIFKKEYFSDFFSIDSEGIKKPFKINFFRFLISDSLLEEFLNPEILNPNFLSNSLIKFLKRKNFSFFLKELHSRLLDQKTSTFSFKKNIIFFKDYINSSIFFEGYFSNRFLQMATLYSNMLLSYLFYNVLDNMFSKTKNLQLLNISINTFKEYKNSDENLLGLILLEKINIINFLTRYVYGFFLIIVSPFFQIIQFYLLFHIYIMIPKDIFMCSLGLFIFYEVFSISDVHTFLMITCVNFFQINFSINISFILNILFNYIYYYCGDPFIFFNNFQAATFGTISLLQIISIFTILSVIFPIFIFKYLSKPFFKYIIFSKNYFDKYLKIKDGWSYEEFLNFINLLSNYNHTIFFYSSTIIQQKSKSKYFNIYLFHLSISKILHGILKFIFRIK